MYDSIHNLKEQLKKASDAGNPVSAYPKLQKYTNEPTKKYG